VGDLLFSKDRTGWKDVFVGKEYQDTLLVYNPTSEGIRLEGFNNPPEITCRKVGHTVEDWNLGGYVVEAGACDTLLVTFCMSNENVLGNYYNVVRFVVGGEVNYDYGFMVNVNVRENFEGWSEEEKEHAPRWRMDTTEFDFGTLREGEEAATVFKVKNTGGSNLIIRKIEITCGCTAVLPGQRVVLPGKETDLRVVFHSAGRKGKQRKLITVYCNDPRQSMIRLVVKGTVK